MKKSAPPDIDDELEKPKKGRPKGTPKSPNSGRKKGTVNRKSLAGMGIHEKLVKKEDYLKLASEEKLKILMDSLWVEAVFKHNITAYKMWFDIYSNLGNVTYLGGYHFTKVMSSLGSIDTFEDMDMCAAHILQLVFENKLSPAGASLLMNLLKERRYFKEAALEPVLTELIKIEKDKHHTNGSMK